MGEHWEDFRSEESGLDMMHRIREQLRSRSTAVPDAIPKAPAPLPPLPAGLLAQASPEAVASARVQAIKVPCPHCGAAVGDQCFIPSRPDRRPAGGSHPSRGVAGLGGIG